MLGRAAFAILLAFAASGCSTPGENLPELESRSLTPYRLGIGDEVRDSVVAASAELSGTQRALVLACEHGAGGGDMGGVVTFPCVAMIPPSLIDFILSRNLAEGVVVAGCSESTCYNRLGVEWTKERFAGTRDPYLRKRVARERLATIWASPFETGRYEAEKAAFAAGLRPSAKTEAAARQAGETMEAQP